jgi:hypothetical protein
MYIGLRVKYPLFLSDFIDSSIFPQIFEKSSYHESPSSGSRVVSCGIQTDRWMDGRTDKHDIANSHFLQFCECAWKLIYQFYVQYTFSLIVTVFRFITQIATEHALIVKLHIQFLTSSYGLHKPTGTVQ